MVFKFSQNILDETNILYLAAFNFKEVEKLDPKLSNYAFKLTNSNEKDYFQIFP